MPAITPPGQEKPSPINSVITFLLIFLITFWILNHFTPKPEKPAEQGSPEEIAASSNVPIVEEEGWNSAESSTPAAEGQPADAQAPADAQPEP
ncbi:MAG: hypothetical protein IKW80_05915, partial [Thermoguttaceae bacterium]|nr:hypothetical protein [Thermoguttaceae bacterium]